MTMRDTRLNENAKQRQELIRKYDKKELTEEQFKEKDNVLKIEGQKIIDELLIKEKNERITQEEQKEKIIKEAKKMAENTNENKEEKKIGKKIQKDSNASLIGKALEMKTVKKVEDVINKVKEKKPDVDVNRIKAMTKTIIRECKKGKGRWAKYTWNEEEFLLVPKED